jgi:hypothetical protein
MTPDELKPTELKPINTHDADDKAWLDFKRPSQASN